MYFVPPLTKFPLELSIGARSQQTRMMGLPGRERNLTISSAVWIQLHERDRQTDTGRQQRPRLRIASRGKNRLRSRPVLSQSPEERLFSLNFVIRKTHIRSRNGVFDVFGAKICRRLKLARTSREKTVLPHAEKETLTRL